MKPHLYMSNGQWFMRYGEVVAMRGPVDGHTYSSWRWHVWIHL